MKRILLLTITLVVFAYNFAAAQSVLDPSDPLNRYPANNPAQPAWGTIGKWVATDRGFNWDRSSYKAYIYKGMAFRVKFPKTYQHGVVDGKKYPVFMFFHGRGEWGTIYDNENQLYHGGQWFRDKVNSGEFDGFLLYPQSQDGYWGAGQFGLLKELLDYMIANNKADANRVSVNGLSAGGGASWEWMLAYPQYTAASLPMSGVGYTIPNYLETYKFTPVWLFQGGKDGAPSPYTAEQVIAASKAAGANIDYKVFPNNGHDVWYDSWYLPGFVPFINKANILTPWPLFGRSEFCVGDPINITAGIAPGFSAYEWQKDGVTIGGANTNKITITALGTYSVRVQRNGVWSEWSPTPLVVKIKVATVTPPITIAGLQSNVIPAPDGNAGVKLRLPATYVQYEWKSVSSGMVVGTDSTVVINVPGDYIARVNELYGCTSNYSAPYTVINANGPDKPDQISGLTSTAVSTNSLQLNWNDKPSPLHNETLFEVYRATTPGGNYQLVAKVPQDIRTYTDQNLTPNVDYYYIIRPVNNTGAAPVSAEVKGVTLKDVTAPGAPVNLRIVTSNNTVIGLAWNAATDDVAIGGYDVYVNGVKTYSTTSNILTVNAYGLTAGTKYAFYVKAKDPSGNFSPASNQVTSTTGSSGFTYKYYEGTWDNLPNFNSLTPVLTGKSANVDISPRLRSDLFAFLWQGYIKITVAGTYFFQISSDDGSRLWVNAPYSFSSTPFINNDGLHGTQAKNASVFLNPGVYPINAAFFERDGGEVMELTWKCAELGINDFVGIPNENLSDTQGGFGTGPTAPTGLGATATSHKSITLKWNDLSNNETGFELYRSTSRTGTFNIIGLTAANATQFIDNNVTPNTRYYYKIRAVGQTGESALVAGYDYTGVWPVDNSIEDISYANNTTLALSGAVYNATAGNVKEGTHSLYFDGVNDYANIGGATSGSLHEAFTERTVAMWIKASATTSKRIIFELGGSDRGLALRINAGTLQAGIANTSGSTASRFSTSTPFTSTAWTHVAVTFGGSSLKLYVNGVLANSVATSFSTVTTTTSASRLAYNNGNNALNENPTAYFQGYIDQLVILNKALTAQEIANIPVPTAKTNVLPGIPAVPTGVTSQALSANSIKLNWSANPANATGLEIWRSIGNESSYALLVKIDSVAASGTSSYKDSSLFANLEYYYKIKSVGDGGTSAFSASTHAGTLNTKPTISPISNSAIRYGTNYQVPVVAQDADSDPLTYTTVGLPSFVQLVQAGESVYLQATPTIAEQGTFNIKVIVDDLHNGKDTAAFTLVVNDNYSPIIANIAAQAATEAIASTATVNLEDIHNEGKTFTWEGLNLPAFVSVTGNNTSATVNFNATLIDAGTYTIMLKVTDNLGASGTKSFTLNVAEKDPTDKIFVKFLKTFPANAPWNNITGLSTYDLKDAQGNTTNVDLLVQGDWFNTGNEGPVTWYDNGVYPDAVLRDYFFYGQMTYYFDGPQFVDMKLAGLDANRKYTFKFHAGTCFWAAADNGVSIFTIGGETRTLAVQNNKTNTVQIDNVAPDANGEILIHLTKPANQIIGVLNGMEISATLDDGSVPAAPKALAGNMASGDINLTWTDVAYNENKYEVYRATADSLGTYTLLYTANANTGAYTDSTVSGNNTYYYKVRGTNASGPSAYSNIYGIVIPNIVPQIDSIVDVKLKATQTANVSVLAKDDVADAITLSVSGLPAFASFTDNGNGHGQFSFTPTNDSKGIFDVTLKATDNHGGVNSRTFKVFVSDKNTTLTYINFADVLEAPAPWNNIPHPFAGERLTNAKDEMGNTTPVDLSLTENWSWSAQNGQNGTENTGIYPDVVIRTSFYTNYTTPHTIRLSQLPTGKKYNFVFFNSQDWGVDATTNFTIGGQTVSLNAAFNTSKTVQINGIVPTNGEVNITVQKGPNAYNGYLSALVIESYDDTLSLVSPSTLKAQATSGTQIVLNWADRANNETGYQVWRSTSPSSGFAQIGGALAANVRTYTDNGLTPNQRYYYKVRAVKSGLYSEFSNSSSSTTFGLQVFISFTETTIAPAPWNNTIARPQVGPFIDNLKDANGVVTNIGLDILQSFENKYIRGINTGNNSGIYADLAMTESFLLYQGKYAELRIRGLNQQMVYDLSFMASSDTWDEFSTKFTVNGSRVAYLNASLNSVAKTTLYRVQADQNGEIIFRVDPAYANTLLGLIGIVVIEGYNIPAEEQQQGQGLRAGGVAMTDAKASNVLTNTGESATFEKVNVFPNPFRETLNVDVQLNKTSSVTADIMDASGRLLQREYRSDVPQGTSTIRIVVGASVKAAGFYMLKLTDKQGNSKVVKIIKQ